MIPLSAASKKKCMQRFVNPVGAFLRIVLSISFLVKIK